MYRYTGKVHTLNGHDKKLSYRRGAAQRAMSVETVRNVSQMFVKLHLISHATSE